MKELLFKRKLRFIKYLIASFMFNIEHLVGIGVFGLVLWAIESKDMDRRIKWNCLKIIKHLSKECWTWQINHMLKIYLPFRTF